MDDVLNWLLQGSLVALATAAVLRLGPRLPARARYRALWIALLSIVLLPIVPVIWRAIPVSDVVASPSPNASVLSIPTRWWTSGRVAIALWIAWSSVCAARIVRALMALRRAKRGCQPFPSNVQARLNCWTTVRAGRRPCRLMLSSDVRSAAVLGFGGPPVIAIAPALLDHLSDDEIDRVVIHEWAHVQRRDDLANAVQLFVRMAVGWHPAVWWIDRRLHLEREVACDEMAVAVTGSAKGYAVCLTRLASLPTVTLPSLPALAALSSSSLRQRVIRILAIGREQQTGSRRAAAVGAGALLLVVAAIVGGHRFVEDDVAIAELPSVTGPMSVVASTTPSGFDTVASGFSRTSGPPDRLRQGYGESRRSSPELERAEAEGGHPVGFGTASNVAPVSDRHSTATRADARATIGVPPTLPIPELTAALENTSAAVAQPNSPALTTVGRILAEPAPLASNVQDPLAVVDSTPWSAAADAGVVVGRTSKKAALATAGFFTRFGKKVAGSF